MFEHGEQRRRQSMGMLYTVTESDNKMRNGSKTCRKHIPQHYKAYDCETWHEALTNFMTRSVLFYTEDCY